jgi:tetratricopeptide (TPR) repeat protein
MTGGSCLSNLPRPKNAFIGRKAELKRLADDLTPEAAQVVIHGMPGVGKSTLAIHYAHQFRASYPGGVWWLDATQGFGTMALKAATELEALMPGLDSGNHLEPEARLRRCFQAWPGEAGEAVLLVVDDLQPSPEGPKLLEQLTENLPVRFRCLVTQRALPLHSTEDLKLLVLAAEDALDLLKQRAGEDGRLRLEREPEEARRLVKAVGGLPLALVLLGGRLRRLPTLKASDLLEELSKSALEAKALSKTHADLLGERGLVETLLGSWRTMGPQARELAKLLSLILPAPIPWELIQRCNPPSTPSAKSWDWQDAVGELAEGNLLESEGERILITLHPLVREFFAIQRDLMEPHLRWWDVLLSQKQAWKYEQHWKNQLKSAAVALAKEWEGKNQLLVVEYWRQAAHVDPRDLGASFGLGYGLMKVGDVAEAGDVFERMKSRAEAAKDDRALSCAQNGIGDVLMAQGDGTGALAAYQASLAIDEALTKRDPANTEWQRDLFVSKAKIGDVLMAQGDGPGALAAYQACLAIAEALAKRDPANTEWQRDLSVSHERIGVVLMVQGDGSGALAAYQARHTIAEALARRDPANTEWQRDLSISHNRIGDVLMAQGDGPGALAAYQASLAIREALAKRDPANTEWLVDVSETCGKLGTLKDMLPVSARRSYLERGKQIILELKQSGRLYANQDFSAQFDEDIQKLDLVNEP